MVSQICIQECFFGRSIHSGMLKVTKVYAESNVNVVFYNYILPKRVF